MYVFSSGQLGGFPKIGAGRKEVLPVQCPLSEAETLKKDASGVGVDGLAGEQIADAHDAELDANSVFEDRDIDLPGLFRLAAQAAGLSVPVAEVLALDGGSTTG